MREYDPIYGPDRNPDHVDRLFISDTVNQVGAICNTCNGEGGNHRRLNNGKPCPINN